jgi:Ca-activated chloride channel family protein
MISFGCSEAEGKLLVTGANFQAAKGRRGEAIGLYMKALEHGAAAPYAEYGLGVAFMEMGEDAAADGRFAESLRLLESEPAGLHRELRYRNHYARGMVFFSKGDFSGAADSFRDALRVSPGRPEAMRNLELSLMSLERDGAAGAGTGEVGGETEAMTLMFEYIRQREVEQWKSREWPEEEHEPGNDR